MHISVSPHAPTHVFSHWDDVTQIQLAILGSEIENSLLFIMMICGEMFSRLHHFFVAVRAACGCWDELAARLMWQHHVCIQFS